MIRSALIALGLSAGGLSAGAQVLVPNAPVLETCGGTGLVIDASDGSSDYVDAQGDQIIASLPYDMGPDAAVHADDGVPAGDVEPVTATTTIEMRAKAVAPSVVRVAAVDDKTLTSRTFTTLDTPLLTAVLQARAAPFDRETIKDIRADGSNPSTGFCP